MSCHVVFVVVVSLICSLPVDVRPDNCTLAKYPLISDIRETRRFRRSGMVQPVKENASMMLLIVHTYQFQTCDSWASDSTSNRVVLSSRIGLEVPASC